MSGIAGRSLLAPKGMMRAPGLEGTWMAIGFCVVGVGTSTRLLVVVVVRVGPRFCFQLWTTQGPFIKKLRLLAKSRSHAFFPEGTLGPMRMALFALCCTIRT